MKFFPSKWDWSEMFRFLSKRYSRRKRSGGRMLTSSNSYSPAKVGDVVDHDSHEVQVVPLQVRVHNWTSGRRVVVFCLVVPYMFRLTPLYHFMHTSWKSKGEGVKYFTFWVHRSKVQGWGWFKYFTFYSIFVRFEKTILHNLTYFRLIGGIQWSRC